MLFVYPARPERRDRIPSACHADGTARVQTVNARQNPDYHALLRAFEGRTGIPVLINTSFNTRGKPIVCTPRDALETFYTTPLDVLAIGPFLLEKGTAAHPDAARRGGSTQSTSRGAGLAHVA
jgi:carbamoyltransferase